MLRILTLLLMLVVLSASPAAPKAKGPADPTYYPTVVGAKWVYDQSGRERVWEVTKVEAKEDQTIITVYDVTGGTPVLAEKMTLSAKGLYRVGFGPFKVDPVCVLRFPLKEGKPGRSGMSPRRGSAGRLRRLPSGRSRRSKCLPESSRPFGWRWK